MESGITGLISLPEAFISRMKEILNENEFLSFYASFNEPPKRGINFNRLKLSHEAAYPGGVPVPWCTTGYIYASEERPAKSIAYHAGLFYIQEPSAMCPAEVLGVEPGQRVLDICAAPGGKSVQIAGHLQGQGLLVSNDASPSRSQALVKNLERAGVTNAIVLTEQPKKIAERFPGFFDRILVDAPCSGEGMFRRDSDSVKAYTANKPEACAVTQKEILYYAEKMLKPNGRMVYSTCTFNTIENENSIENFSLIKINHNALGIAPGLDPARKTARIWPHLAQGEGHFIALMEKAGAEQADFPNRRQSRQMLSRSGMVHFYAFNDLYLNRDIPGNYILHGKNLYVQPFPLDLSGLRVSRSGWYLGECHDSRFIPSHALALGIRKEDARFSVELSEADAFKYLRGESIEYDMNCEAVNPYVLICQNGFPLGWARYMNGRLKNKLPTGWVIKN